MKRMLGLAAAASALVLALSGCANYSNSSETTDAGSSDKPALIADGKLTVCTHLSFKPFQFKDPSTNEIVG